MITSTYPVFTLPEPIAEEKKSLINLNSKAKAYTALGLGILFIAWSAIFVKWSAVPGPVSAFYRLFFAAAVLAPIWAVKNSLNGKNPLTVLKQTSTGTIILASVAGLLFAADLALYNTSILMTSAANATLLGNNAPIMVALAAWLIFGSKPGGVFWAGLSIATAGTFVIVGGDLFTNPHLGYGDLFAIIASICYAAYLIVVARARSVLDTLTLVTITVVSGAIALLLLTVMTGAKLVGFSTTTWLSLLALGLIAQVGGYLSITYALGHLPPTTTSICLLVQAPLTALIAIPLLGESISIFQIVGGTLVLSGIYVVTRYATTSEETSMETQHVTVAEPVAAYSGTTDPYIDH